MLTLFDAPSREASCIRRSRTSTPVQSLGLLNETQRVEMARKLAERLILASDNPTGRINQLFRLIACREASLSEVDVCTSLLEHSQERYSQAPENAEQLLATGEAAVNQDLDPIEVAAWTSVTLTVLASDLAILLY